MKISENEINNLQPTEAIIPYVSFTINLNIINKYGRIINEVLLPLSASLNVLIITYNDIWGIELPMEC